MIRFVFLFIGRVSLAAAVTSLIYDGLKSIVDQTVYISSVGLIWENIPQSWVAALQPALEWLADVWQGVIQSYLLEQPAWLVLGIIGAMMVWTKEEAADRTRTRSKASLDASSIAMSNGGARRAPGAG